MYKTNKSFHICWLLAAFFGLSLSLKAQVFKTFINDGKQVDSVKATEYMLVAKLSDSVWIMKYCDIYNNILMQGHYTSQDLNVANGEFLYYNYYFSNKSDSKKDVSEGVKNYLRSKGNYVKGVKSGIWSEYVYGGRLASTSVFVDNHLNGEYKGYNIDSGKPFIEGQYVNDQKEGDWNMVGSTGVISSTDIYHNGIIINKVAYKSAYTPPKAPDGFTAYFKNALSNKITDDLKGRIAISLTITTDGYVTDPKIVKTSEGDFKQEFLNSILKIATSSVTWIPAYDSKLKTNVEGIAQLVIKIDNGSVDVRILDFHGADKNFYDITH